MCRNKNQGLTLVEMLIVVGIIAILARISLPAYTDYMARGKLTEAQVLLASYRTNMEQYYQDMRSYSVSNVSPGSAICGVSAASMVSRYFTFGCSVTGAGATQTYTAIASSVAGQGLGAAADYVYTIDDNNLRSTTRFRGAAAVSGVGCWISKRGQTC